MKFLTFILSFYIFSLAVMPAIQVLNSKAVEECCEGCCNEEKSTDSKETPSKDCQTACNPFLSCSSCLGFTAQVFTVSLEPKEVTSIDHYIYKAQAIQSIATSIWQPPKIS